MEPQKADPPISQGDFSSATNPMGPASFSVDEEKVLRQSEGVARGSENQLLPGFSPMEDPLKKERREGGVTLWSIIQGVRVTYGLKPDGEDREEAFIRSYVRLCEKYDIRGGVEPEVILLSMCAGWAVEAYTIWQEHKKEKGPQLPPDVDPSHEPTDESNRPG